MREKHSKINLVLKAFGSTCWAIMPEKLEAMAELLELRSQGFAFDAGEIQARIGAPRERASAKTASIAVIPIIGSISNRIGLMSEGSGGTSLDVFRSQFRDALNSPSIGAIVLDVDSPGENVDGVTETAAEIFKARGEKPIIAVANTLAASAAFWIATAADEFVASPSAQVGSVGVLAVHTDTSEAEEAQGIKTKIIKAGRFKAEGIGGPLTDEAEAALQDRVDDAFDTFTKDLARNRGVSQATVKKNFGEGRVVSANRALAAGMIDRIETFDQAIARIASGKVKTRVRPEGDVIELHAEDLDRRSRRLRSLGVRGETFSL